MKILNRHWRIKKEKFDSEGRAVEGSNHPYVSFFDILKTLIFENSVDTGERIVIETLDHYKND